MASRISCNCFIESRSVDIVSHFEGMDTFQVSLLKTGGRGNKGLKYNVLIWTDKSVKVKGGE